VVLMGAGLPQLRGRMMTEREESQDESHRIVL
jgi:hypothetical protein